MDHELFNKKVFEIEDYIQALEMPIDMDFGMLLVLLNLACP